MENSQKIWKYMDLAKFISLLSRQTLYFACPSDFHDPFEGFIPKSWAIQVLKRDEERFKYFESQRNACSDIPGKHSTLLDDAVNGLNKYLQNVILDFNSKHGVNCWHKSDYESEAMWKLYSLSGQGIAIESTIDQLKHSIVNEDSLEIVDVTYLSEDNPGEIDGEINYLALKRQSFEHEKELRAIVLLNEIGKGKFVECDLEKLISHIHISPFSDPYLIEAVKYTCLNIGKPITRSRLFEKPDYSFKALLSNSEK